MATAPRDGTLVRRWLGADGSTIVGRYSDKWWGWIDYGDPWPLIRGDIRFRGWQPIDQAAHRKTLFRREPRRKRPPITVVVPQAAQVAQAAKIVVSSIVRAKRPRTRRAGLPTVCCSARTSLLHSLPEARGATIRACSSGLRYKRRAADPVEVSRH
jgi:hypothetical protein